MGVYSIRKTQEEFEEEIKSILPNLQILGTYLGRKEKILTRCLVDGYEWYPQAGNLLCGHGCPVCSGRTVMKGVNDLLTTHPDMVRYLVNIEDGYKYKSGSHSYIDFKCPDCGHIRHLQIKSVTTQGFSCTVCGDGVSYPNKFARGLLKQLPIENFKEEFSPNWAGRYLYDNYFEYKGMPYILEMDGHFHYKTNTMTGTTKEDAQKIDNYKNDLATLNGIIVIRIECLKSEPDYIENNIRNSLMNYLFDLNSVDWSKCILNTKSNRCKEVCLFYQEHKHEMLNAEIAQKFGIHETTVTRYLKIGRKVGWINDDIDISLIRSMKTSNPKSKRLIVRDINSNEMLYDFKSVNLGIKYFDSILNIKLYSHGISHAIENKKGSKKGIYKGYRFEYA